ncbi:TB2/DP1, HVA22 family [Dictyocaulus viviparus]|uniref:Receptor expression-enhancing protein n=1 Tax=Dictyocaulus viviparus TaxID=29172 RepID=A0A0D8Y6M6_DICVI|nr:TB2/DP1, HVA22 family [Dictyocaulus viviparus]
MSVNEPVAAPVAATSDGPMEGGGSPKGGLNPLEGIKKAHEDLVAWCYKSHGSVVDAQLAKLDEAQVKREHVAYGLIGLMSLYLITGGQAFFLSAVIAFTYPAYDSIQVFRAKDSAEALHLLLYWVPFGFFALLDSTFFSDLPAYFFLKTCFLLFLFLPQTQGAKLIYFKVIEPVAKLIDDLQKKLI